MGFPACARFLDKKTNTGWKSHVFRKHREQSGPAAEPLVSNGSIGAELGRGVGERREQSGADSGGEGRVVFFRGGQISDELPVITRSARVANCNLGKISVRGENFSFSPSELSGAQICNIGFDWAVCSLYKLLETSQYRQRGSSLPAFGGLQLVQATDDSAQRAVDETHFFPFLYRISPGSRIFSE